MTPTTPAQPSIPPCVAHCTHCLPVCAELSVTGSSPPQTFSRWLFKNQFKAAWCVGPPQFWLGALAGTVAPPPSPKATSRAIFDDFHTGDRCRWSVQASQWPIPASGHCNNSPATGLSAVGPLLVQGCSRECSPPLAQDAHAAHVESGGFSRRSALSAPRGVAQATPCTWGYRPGAARRSPSPCPAAPLSCLHALEPCSSIVVTCCHPRRESGGLSRRSAPSAPRGVAQATPRTWGR